MNAVFKLVSPTPALPREREREKVAAKILFVALPLAFVVVVAGAYTRIADAGLGCPDWPGCYGKLVGAPSAEEAAAFVAGGNEDAPGGFDKQKSVIEIAHRYVAGLLALIIFAAAFAGWKRREATKNIALVLAALVLGQALLGMLTVTDKLRPAIVIAHLLGGMLILSLLAFASARAFCPSRKFDIAPVFGFVAVLVLFAQIALGGWVSANYAGLSCPDFPLCQGSLLPEVADFSGFNLSRELHENADGEPITNAALVTIHWLHRVGALVAFVVVAVFAVVCFRAGLRFGGGVLFCLLVIQINIGIAAVLLRLPVLVALMHNAFAALLVINVSFLLARVVSSADNSRTRQFPAPTIPTHDNSLPRPFPGGRENE